MTTIHVETLSYREVNTLVAEKFFGWNPNSSGPVSYIPDYCGEISLAWEVLTKIKEHPWDTLVLTYDAGEWQLKMVEDGGRTVIGPISVTAPLAICRAAVMG